MKLKKTDIMMTVSMSIGMLFLTGCSSKSPYTKEQAMVKKGYEAIKDTLLDPESMLVYDCYAWSAKSEKQLMAEMDAKKDEAAEEVSDDLFSVYYHVGARNRMGGMSESADSSSSYSSFFPAFPRIRRTV